MEFWKWILIDLAIVNQIFLCWLIGLHSHLIWKNKQIKEQKESRYKTIRRKYGGSVKQIKEQKQ